MPTVRLNNGNIEADGSLNALSITTQEIQTDNLNVTGQLTASGDVTANRIIGNVNVTGSLAASAITADNISSVNNLEANSVSVGGDFQITTLITSSIRALEHVITETLHTSGVYGLCQVDGTVTADDLHVASGVNALTMDCETLNVEQTVYTTEMQTMTANISDTLTVGGDLIVEGDDDRVLGDTITDVSSNSGPLSLNMRHNHWYNAGLISLINILADTDSGRVKTCYLISSAANPIVLNGVQWLWEPVELEDTSKTHVVALQQIGAGPVMANVAYSY